METHNSSTSRNTAISPCPLVSKQTELLSCRTSFVSASATFPGVDVYSTVTLPHLIWSELIWYLLWMCVDRSLTILPFEIEIYAWLCLLLPCLDFQREFHPAHWNYKAKGFHSHKWQSNKLCALWALYSYILICAAPGYSTFRKYEYIARSILFVESILSPV